jgi:hypothetical protein
MKKIRVALSVLATASLVLFASVQVQGSSIIVANGFVHDERGKPVSGISLYIASSDPATGQTLNVWKTTDSKGQFQAQTFSNYKLHLTMGAAKCLSKGTPFEGTVSSASKTIDLTVPTERVVKFRVTTPSGTPISNVQTTVLERDFGNGFSCPSQPHAKTDQDGYGLVNIFEGGSTTRPTDQAGIIYYQPFEGVQLTKWVSEADLEDNSVRVILDDVPSADLAAPTVAKTSGFDVSVLLRDADGSISAASLPNTLSEASLFGAKSRLQFKTLELMKRTFVNGKWSSWTSQAKAKVGLNGKLKFSKIKLKKNRYQFKVAGVGFSLGTKAKTVLVK